MGVDSLLISKINAKITTKLSGLFDSNPIPTNWILEFNSWNDGGSWIDYETWND